MGRKGKYTTASKWLNRSRTVGEIVPDRMYTKMTWVGQESVNSGVTGTVQYITSLNNPKLPNNVFNVQGCTGFFELSQFYNQCIVYGSKIRVECVNTDTPPIRMVLFPFNQGSTSNWNTVEEALAQPYARDRIISATTGMDRATLTHYISTAKINGTTRQKIKDDDGFSMLTGNTSPPAEESKWALLMYSTVSNAISFTVTVKVTYYVEFFDRTILPQTTIP